jgi:hypothetical protein
MEPTFRIDVRARKIGRSAVGGAVSPLTFGATMLPLRRLTLFANLEAGRARIPS